MYWRHHRRCEFVFLDKSAGQYGRLREEQGMAWRFDTDDPLALFAGHGWNAAMKNPAEEGAKYDSQRFPVNPGSWSFFVVARLI